MASELRVDKIHNEGGDNDSGIDLSTNDQIVLKTANTTRLTMDATGQTTIVGEGGTTTTSLQQGLIKAWINHDASVSVDDSFNRSGNTDVDTGKFRTAYTHPMGNALYAVLGTASVGGHFTSLGINSNDNGITTTTVDVYTSRTDNGNLSDPAIITYAVSGDLA